VIEEEAIEETDAAQVEEGNVPAPPKLKKRQWTSLSHFGVCFPEPYKSDPRTNVITIKGERINMTPEQEEMAVAWAKKIGTPYVEDPVFQENFLADFLRLFPPKFRDAEIDDVIFPTLPEKVELTKEEKKALAAERKKKRMELKEKFGYAMVDGVKTEIANWVVEPPGLFMGRGCIAEDSIVKTDSASKYVQELGVGDKIATRCGPDKMSYESVAAVAKQGIRNVYQLGTRTHSIRATGNHPFLALRSKKIESRKGDGIFSDQRFTPTLSWVPLSKLKVGDHVVSVKQGGALRTDDHSSATPVKSSGFSSGDSSKLDLLNSEVFSLERILEIKESGRVQTFDVSMSDWRNPNFIADGFVVHNSHPMRGHWKPRVEEADITLNLDQKAPVPPGKWKIIHEPRNMWIACWTDKLSDKVKYVWLHDSSSLRQMRDKGKYEKAKKLEQYIKKVESYITKAMRSRDLRERKIATACFLIDRLAMRVGDEKDEDEADTVGASTLRVEHLIFAKQNAVDFDFFGKDYVRWQKTLEVSPNEIAAIDNLREFCKGKEPDALIFDGITSRHVNEFFGKALPGLTAKVFRTYIATSVVRDYLKIHNQFPEGTPEYEKLYQARLANLEAALKCNHKRTPPKTFEQALQKKKDKFEELKKTVPKTEKQQEKHKLRLAKLQKQIELTEQTRDYNLNTSLRNYIDPRVYKSWADKVGLDWKLLYSGTLQRKMAWVDSGAGVRDEASIPVTVNTDQK
jgi:DNA topoisomerase IB/mRNA-degrading endonuclease YafQ of YafQ-DinJ toxin-antitoxin module